MTLLALAPAHDETPDTVEFDAPARRDEGGCTPFLDQHRSSAGCPDRQAIAIEHWDLPLGAGDMDAPGAATGRGERTAGAIEPWQLRLVAHAPGGEAVADDLDGASGGCAIARSVDGGKGLLDLGHVADVRRDGHGELERLADITHVEACREALAVRTKPVGGEFGGAVAH